MDRGFVGRVLAERYRLDQEIGAGGFGVVFRASDLRLEKVVAVKVLSRDVTENPDALARFNLEAIAAARAGHEGIVNVTDFGRDEDLAFLVMEFIEGYSLESLLSSRQPFVPARALAIAARTAQALAAAHAASIIHRDLKPANVMLTVMGSVSDFVKVLDFGISKILGEESASRTLTGAGEVVGTPRYMSPEQCVGKREIDGRADVYALGTILYEMLTGQPPFEGTSSYEVVHNKLSADPVAPSECNPDLTHEDEVDALVLTGLERDLAKRFASMEAFEIEIRRVLALFDPAAAVALRPLRRPSRPVIRPSVPDQESTSALTAASETGRAASQRSGRRRHSGGSTRRSSTLGRGWIAVAAVVAAAGAAGMTWRLQGTTGLVPALPPPRVVSTAPAPQRVAPAPVHIHLVLDPPSALAELEGLVVRDNPIQLARSERPLHLVVSAPGYVTAYRELVPAADGEIEVRLGAVAKPPPASVGLRRESRERLPDSPL